MSGKHATFLVKKDVDDYQVKVDKLYGLPKRGVHIGGGRHVDLDDPAQSGWTLHYDAPRKHPDRDEWAHLSVDPDVDGDNAVLSLDELEDLRSEKLNEKDLEEDWAPDDPLEAEGPGPAIIG